jgi:anthranilate synthase component 2
LVHYLGELGAKVEVYRNDAISVGEILKRAPQGIVISPGPCDPDRAGICLELVERAAGTLPILGICLGHQTIGQVFGGRVVRAPVPMHGKMSRIHHNDAGVLRGLPQDFLATRYHSLTVAAEDLPACLEATAHSDDGLIMGLTHRELNVHGVQFHPESIATEHGHRLLRNFLDLAAAGGKRPAEPAKQVA